MTFVLFTVLTLTMMTACKNKQGKPDQTAPKEQSDQGLPCLSTVL